MSPSATAWSTSVDRSNVLNVVWPNLFACCRACRTGVEAVGPSVRIPSMSGSDDSLFPIVWVMPPGSFRSTGTTSASNPSPSLKPLHRRSSPTLPTSWFTQIAWVTPASFIRSPASCPATSSFCPMCARTPRSENTSLPELIEITGIPASTAFLIDGPSASASGMLTIRPSGFEATAPSIRWLLATMSKVGGALYVTDTPSSWAAALTPFDTIDQNGSDAWPWVTTAMRKLVCLTAPPLVAVVPGDGFLLPPEVHATAATSTSGRTAQVRRLFTPPSSLGTPHRVRPHPSGLRWPGCRGPAPPRPCGGARGSPPHRAPDQFPLREPPSVPCPARGRTIRRTPRREALARSRGRRGLPPRAAGTCLLPPPPGIRARPPAPARPVRRPRPSCVRAPPAPRPSSRHPGGRRRLPCGVPCPGTRGHQS